MHRRQPLLRTPSVEGAWTAEPQAAQKRGPCAAHVASVPRAPGSTLVRAPKARRSAQHAKIAQEQDERGRRWNPRCIFIDREFTPLHVAGTSLSILIC
jgi:hypothetical protein